MSALARKADNSVWPNGEQSCERSIQSVEQKAGPASQACCVARGGAVTFAEQSKDIAGVLGGTAVKRSGKGMAG